MRKVVAKVVEDKGGFSRLLRLFGGALDTLRTTNPPWIDRTGYGGTRPYEGAKIEQSGDRRFLKLLEAAEEKGRG